MKLPDTDISPLMWIMLDDGIGAVHASTIMAVIPDTSAPKTKALMITTVFPEGLTVHGTAMSVLLTWWQIIEDANEELDEEPSYESIGDLLAEHFAVDIEAADDDVIVIDDLDEEVLEAMGLRLVPKVDG